MKKTMIRKNRFLLPILFFAIFAMTTIGISHASEIKPEKADVEQVVKMLQENEVPKDKIEGLVEKYLKNELWDSFKEEYNYIEPQIKEENYQKIIYPDGSFKILEEKIIGNQRNSVASHDNTIVPYMDSVDYTNGYRVSKNLGLVGMEFTVDFAQDRVRNMGRILSMYDRNIWTIGGTYSNMQSGFWSDWRKPTCAWMSADLQTYNGTSSSFGWVKFYVDGQSYWIDWQ